MRTLTPSSPRPSSPLTGPSASPRSCSRCSSRDILSCGDDDDDGGGGDEYDDDGGDGGGDDDDGGL